MFERNKKETNQKDHDRLKRYFGHCFEISEIEENDLLPVGGNSTLNSEFNVMVRVDFNSFEEFFNKTSESIKTLSLNDLEKWLDSNNINVDVQMFAHLFAFTRALEKHYPIEKDNRKENRRLLYDESGNKLKLSDIFSKNVGMCAEIAALAQGYLQTVGITSTYFSGDLISKSNLNPSEDEFSSPHSFIVIRHENALYVFDPARPTKTNGGDFPSIYQFEVDFDSEIQKDEKKFIAGKNLISKKISYFGVNNHTVVWPDKHVIFYSE